MTIDFVKLNDPAFRAQVRAEEEARAAQEQKIDDKISELINLMYLAPDNDGYAPFTEKEAMFLTSLRAKRMRFFATTEKQLNWLQSIYDQHLGSAKNEEVVTESPQAKRPRFNFGRR